MIPDMTFKKTSAKFGQWADIRAGTVYGLGFNTDSLLNKFLENFNDIRDRAMELKGQCDMKEVDSDGIRDNEEKVHVNIRSTKENMSTSSSTPTKKLPTTTPNGSNLSELDEEQRIEPMNKFPTLPGHVTSSSSDLKNLRLQNELLRQALTQSNSNTKKWESEMQNLKTTNSRLTAALQESMTNVDQWHRQLATYKEENEKLKRKLNEAERSHKHDSDGVSDQLEQVQRQMNQLQLENNEKSQECNLLQQKLGVLAAIERQHTDCTNRFKKSQEECVSLKNRLQAFEERMTSLSREKHQRQRMVTELTNRVSEISDILQQLQASS